MADDAYEFRIQNFKNYFANKDEYLRFVRSYSNGNSINSVKMIVDGIAEYDPALAKIYNKFTGIHEELIEYCRSRLEGT